MGSIILALALFLNALTNDSRNGNCVGVEEAFDAIGVAVVVYEDCSVEVVS